MTMRTLMGALLVGIATLPALATADVLCVSKGGALHARPACRRSEKALTRDRLGTLPAPTVGAPGAQGQPATLGVRLVDAAGAEVGPIVTWQRFTWLVTRWVPTLARFVLIRYPRDGVLPDVELVHAAPGCTGPAFYEGGLTSGFLLPLVHSSFGSSVLVMDGPSQELPIESTEYVSPLGCRSGDTSTPIGSCCHTQSLGPRSGLLQVTRLERSAFGVTEPVHEVQP